MMATVAVVPPFERFYDEHREAIFGFLARRLGRTAAEDAFQETFLRALRAYDRLEHARHLRAWVFTIAARVAVDVHRSKPGDTVPLDDESRGGEDRTPAYLELEHLAQELPPTERAAVVLRYGYDLDYAEIGAALGSSADAARQAASSGIRRLRKKEGVK
jgi:RNA polymerase sigma-70 factor (ECF subfamily)